ncbi:MAG: major capsid protein [Alphaproteobacteria bacterium]
MDIFSTQVLSKVVEYLPTPSSFLLDTFFPSVQTSDKEEIFFDVTSSKPRISPFVSPYLPGKVVDNNGYQTKSFKPAYVKDKRRFDADTPYKRLAGETIGGSLSPKQRFERAVATTLTDQLDNLTRREEVMASEILRTGKVVISGDGYPSTTVDFGRDSSFTKALTGTNTWATSTINPLDNLESWAGDIQNKAGVVAKTVILDPDAWKTFRNNPLVEKYLTDLRRGTNNTLNVDPMIRGNDNKARYVGSIGDFDFVVYNDIYINDEGVETNLLPSNTVILGSKDGLEGTRCYGSIKDERANFTASRYFTKSWIEEDPAVRWLLLQSAPLVVPYRPNASMCVTVA